MKTPKPQPTTPAIERAIRAHVPDPIAHYLYGAAERAKVPYSLALAVCQMESGFRNVWGHDHGKFREAGAVTGNGVMRYWTAPASARPNGVGPMQITSLALQEQAANIGGLADARATIEVGVRFLGELCASYGMHDGVRRYNGSGPAAERYSVAVAALRNHWHHIVSPA